VRLKRVDLPQEVSESVYRRMEAERKRVANELRSLGFAEAEQIRANADKQREVIIAEAYRDAQRIKGEGDAKAAAIYAKAFQQNPEFYAFYRSLRRTGRVPQQGDDGAHPSSDFFRYLKKLDWSPLATEAEPVHRWRSWRAACGRVCAGARAEGALPPRRACARRLPARADE
jgi:membrane protease subunit HflC